MGESTRNVKREITEELIREVDQNVDSPSHRAAIVWQNIKVSYPNWTTWDLLCFCVELLGMVSAEFPWLKSSAVQLSRLVYSAHYFYPQNINARIGSEAQYQPPRQHTRTEPRSNGT